MHSVPHVCFLEAVITCVTLMVGIGVTQVVGIYNLVLFALGSLLIHLAQTVLTGVLVLYK